MAHRRKPGLISRIYDASGRMVKPGTDRLWGWLSGNGAWNVDDGRRTIQNTVLRNCILPDFFRLYRKEGAAFGSVPDCRLAGGRMAVKLRGRFAVEASLLIPGICILLVYLFFFTLYAHDYAVCTHAALECGIKGIYRDGAAPVLIEERVEEDLRRKLSERLLWIRNLEVEVQVNAVREIVHISGAGSFLPVDGIEVNQTLYRYAPCETIRRSRWLRKKEE